MASNSTCRHSIIRALLVASAWILAPLHAAGQQDPDLMALKGAIVIVIVKGVSPSLGNAPVATQGTGFFTSRDGFLVTSYHLRTKLGDAPDDSVQYEVHFGTTSTGFVRAAPIYVNQMADIMVLYASVGDRNVQTLQRVDRTNEVAGKTPVFTVGYPVGYQYSVDKGIIRSFGGLIAPIPAWTTSLAFKSGQSGSPIVLENGKAIAIAKAVDADAASIGLVVPARLVPNEFWDSLSPASTTATLAQNAKDAKVFDRVIVEALTPKIATTRTMAFSVTNEPCTFNPPKTIVVSATPGWQIEPGSVRLLLTRTEGLRARASVSSQTSSGFVIDSSIQNAGSCVTGVQAWGGIRGSLSGFATYMEYPNTPQFIAVSDTAAIGSVRSPLPDIPLSNIKFSIRSKTGRIFEFKPLDSEITTDGSRLALDNARIISRVLGPQ